ncbi:hypothetical protein D3C83_68180 [compost metagenome]
MWIDAETCLLHPIERFPVSRKWFSPPDEKIVSKHVELAFGYETRVELSNGAGRSITRIGKSRLSGFFTFCVGPVENITWDKNFATHFERRVDLLCLSS